MATPSQEVVYVCNVILIKIPILHMNRTKFLRKQNEPGLVEQ